MNKRQQFLEQIKRKADLASSDWPEWKHRVLHNSFRAKNDKSRKVVMLNAGS